MVVFEFWPGVCKSYFRVARQPQTKRNLKRRGNPMSYLKYAIATLALTLFVTPSIASAQSLQTLGTRRGAIGGAILGAIIGDQNNEGLAGAAIGGLVGGAIGNVTGRNLDRRYSGGQSSYNYGGYGGASYNRPAPYKKVAPVPYKRVAPTYRPSPYRGGGGGYGRPSCGGRGY